jgi:GMP synthase (glutamine-hydrolysing)
MILVIDFGSQTAHLIGRRIRDLGVAVEFSDPEAALEKINQLKPKGIIFSGGPASVYEPGAPTIDKKIFTLGIPILGICYGQQLTATLLGGEVKPGKVKEYGPAVLEINQPSRLFSHIIDNHFGVFMSHGDEVVTAPPGFTFAASTRSIPAAVMQNENTNIYCLQFHPEVKHTRNGALILRNFLSEVCGLPIKKRILSVDSFVKIAQEAIGEGKAIAAVSGGVDSTVAAALLARAIGSQLIPIYIDNGLMRLDNRGHILNVFENILKVPLKIIDAKERFLRALKGITDPEDKRKIIGQLYIACFEEEAALHPDATDLIQGTIYSDVIESQGSKHAAKIKSHHNVGGLPEKMNLRLFEPLRDLYKDEVRKLGKKLGLPEEIVAQQPFPGPGQAIRIIGEVTEDRLNRQQQADQIVLEEMAKAGWMKKVFQSFPVLTDTKSTAVKGDGRFYGEVMALRVYGSIDIMTASWSRLPYSLLQAISSRIVNEVPGISRVVYDITTKPPATMEWE